MKKPIEAAFVLAAGRGERLRPLTDHMPKPLLPYRDRPLLDHILERLQPLGLKRVVLNAWHAKERVVEYAKARKGKFPFEVLVSEEDELLGTGGGLKKACRLLGDTPFLMLNGDCLWKGDIAGFCNRALASEEAATWWLTSVERDQTVIGVRDSKLVQIGKLWKSGDPLQTGCFTGIQVIQKLEVDKLPDQGCIVRQYWIPQLERNALHLRGDFEGLEAWTDIGTLERYRSLS